MKYACFFLASAADPYESVWCGVAGPVPVGQPAEAAVRHRARQVVERAGQTCPSRDQRVIFFKLVLPRVIVFKLVLPRVIVFMLVLTRGTRESYFLS